MKVYVTGHWNSEEIEMDLDDLGMTPDQGPFFEGVFADFSTALVATKSAAEQSQNWLDVTDEIPSWIWADEAWTEGMGGRRVFTSRAVPIDGEADQEYGIPYLTAVVVELDLG